MRIRKWLRAVHTCNRILGTVFETVGGFVKGTFHDDSALRTEFAVTVHSLIFSARRGSNEDSRDTYIEKRLSLVQILSV